MNPATKRPGDARFALVLACVYAGVVAVGMAYHELWRDEWQAWLMARDSASIAELLHVMRYEGHPAAWYLLLFGVSRFTRDPAAMQALHLVIAATVVWIVARWSPLTRVQRVLFAFGYFIVYEYGVISRGYSLGALALFAFCALWPGRHRGYALLALPLIVMAQTSAYGVVLVAALGVGLIAEWLFDAELRAKVRANGWRMAAAALAVLASVALSIAQLRPPTDAVWTGTALRGEETIDLAAAREATLLVPRVLVPIPHTPREIPEWGSNLLVDGGLVENTPVYAALILGLIGLGMARRPVALVVYVAGIAGLLAFAYGVHFGYLRHHGHIVLITVAAWWLALENGPRLRWLPDRADSAVLRSGRYTLTGLLAVQALAGGVMLAADVRHPFTMAARAAAALRAEGADTMLVAGTPTRNVTSIAGYLDRPVHFLGNGTEGTYAVWGEVGPDLPRDSIIGRAARLLGPDRPALLLVTPWPLTRDRTPDGRIVAEERAFFLGQLLRDGSYHVYRVRRVVPD